MKKSIAMTAMAATVSAVALMASCAEEEQLPWSDSSSEQQIAILPEDDLTFGYNSIITETDSVSFVSIPLNTNVPVQVSCLKGYTDLQCVKVDGKYCLQVANPAQARLGVDEVTLTIKGHPELTKRFLFTVNDSKTLTRADDEEQNPLKKRFADVFSLGQYIWLDPSETHPTSPILNAESLYKGLSDISDLKDIIQADPLSAPTYEVLKCEGSTKQEHTNNWAVSLGLDNIPINEAAQLGLDISFSRKSASKHYYEYMTESKNARCAIGKLSLSMLSIPACDTLWKRLISPEFDNVLNNPNTNVYKRFPETIDGACDIIDSYGSHLLNICALGTKATVQYRKKSDMTNTSMEWAVKLSIEKKKEELNGGGGNKYTKDAVEAANYINANRNPKGNVGYQQSVSDYLEEIEMEMTYKLIGGNVSEGPSVADWKPTADPKNWYPVHYKDDAFNHNIFRAIYELCQDSTSIRYQTLKEAINGRNENGINYYAAYKAKQRGITLTEPETEWVLAGVYVDVNASTSSSYHPSPVKRTLADGKTTCTFYPYIDLALQDGKCLDTETGDFGKCVRYDAHYWYYAMMMRDDFPGLEDIKLIDLGHKKEYMNNKGYCSCLNDGAEDFGDGWSCNETNNFILMAKPIDPEDKVTKPITGLRLEIFDKRDKTGDNDVLGVSGGTGRSANGANSKRYQRYWVDDWRNKVSYVTDCKDKIQPVYFLSCVRQPWYIFLSTVRTPILHEHAYLEYPSDMPKGH